VTAILKLRLTLGILVIFLLQCRTIQQTSYTIDPSLKPADLWLPGLDGGPPRPIAAIAGPTGRKTEIATNEVILHPRSQQELDAFLTKYGGTILRDGTPFVFTPPATPPTPIAPSGWLLIRIDPSRSELHDLQRGLADGALPGRYRFSSEQAARLIALIAREKHLGIGLNLVLHPTGVYEHPDGLGGHLDASTWWWMTEDDDPNRPGDQGLSIGVIRAWDYLKYHGLPPTNGIFRPARIAIVDGGFALDESSGLPLDGNRDYGIGIMQADIVDQDGTAGGANLLQCGGTPCAWHGQSVFGVAAAKPQNLYGGAGTGGQVVWPMLVRVSSDVYTWADGIRSAAINGADVINLSMSASCGDFAWVCSIRPNDRYAVSQSAVNLARAWGATVIASAGNDGVDAGDDDTIPCKLDGVICVGSVDRKGNNLFNFGDAVDIWAPTDILSTVTPESLWTDTNDTGEDEIARFGGTSASSPFIAGIVGLMKALDPTLSSEQVQDILQSTANHSTDSTNPITDPKVRTGWVDAFRAVLAVRPNQPPVVQWHALNPAAPWTGTRLEVDASDPELTPDTSSRWPLRVVFKSNLDGELCSVSIPPYACSSGPLTIAHHIITATATDAFGASASAARNLNVINRTPTPHIHEPLASGTYFSHQPVMLAATVPDLDENIPQSAVEWRSNRDGILGSGWEFNTNLTAGTHLLSVRATDLQGAIGEASVTISVQSGAGFPSVAIIEPAPGLFVSPGTSITLRGSATDPEDGQLSGASLEWFSDLDGPLGTGDSLTVVLSGPVHPCNPESFVHVVRLRATDADGHSVEVKVRITVGMIC
jgi:hypothetical protein